MKTKKFIYDEEMPPIIYRPGTSDETIINSVLVNQQEYLFPNLANANVVFDIGANIGVTAIILSKIYPGAIIHAFEPDEQNFKLLCQNTSHLKNVARYEVAIDNYNGETTLFGSDDPANLGGYSTTKKPESSAMLEKKVPVVRMAGLCLKFGHPDVIKIDCEGAEFNILTDIPQIEKVLWISGELHNIRDFELLSKLCPTHEIQTARTFGSGCWHFQAANRAEMFQNVARPLTPKT